MATVNNKVLFGFDKDSNGNYIFNDISAYVMGVDFGRGKSDQFQTYDAGQCAVTLQNRDRIFDPANGSGSPYQSQIRPAGWLQVFVNDVQKFDGAIEDWNFSYDLSGDSIAIVTAFDGLAKLNKVTLANYVVSQELSSARVSAVLNLPDVSWPVSKRNISTGGVQVVGGTVGGTVGGVDALSYLQQVEASEHGRLFVDGAGNLTFKSIYDGFYESRYTEYRYNLCLNPGFESNTNSWSGSVTRSTAQFVYGSASGSVTSGSAVSIAFDGSANTTYALSLYVYALSAGTVTLSGLGGTANTVEASTAVAVPATTWTRASLLYLSGQDSHAFRVTPSVGAFIDGMLIEPSDSLGEYFDGTVKPADTDTTTYTSSWATA